MTIQRDTLSRNAAADSFATQLGASPLLVFLTAAPPAATTDADTGSVVATLTLPSTPFAAASAGTLAKTGTWSGTVSLAGTGHVIRGYRLKTAGGVTKEQGTAGTPVTMATTSATAANGNVITVASTSGLAAGRTVSGTGVPTGAKIAAVLTGTTVLIDRTSTAGIASGADVTFGWDANLDGDTVNFGQSINVGTFERGEPDA